MFNLFGKKKAKSPVTSDDALWIENNLLWIHQRIVDITKQPTFLPKTPYFDRHFKGNERDAEYLLERIGDMFGIDSNNIRLGFFDEQTHDFGYGVSTMKEDSDGRAGTYLFDDGRHEINIEVGQLKNTESLIATIAHEMSHYILIGMHEIGYSDDTENEYLTDLLAIAYGFGIFIGNSSFYRKTWTSGDGYSGWQIGKQGYLPREVTGYAMALIEMYKRFPEQDPEIFSFMQKDFQRTFRKSLAYVNENQGEIKQRGNSENLFVW